MKKLLILLAIFITATSLYAQYEAKGIIYLGWQGSTNHIKNAYSTHDVDNNFTFYNDGFMYNYVDWRMGIYNGNNVGEVDLSGIAYAFVGLIYMIDDKPFRENTGKLRQLPKNFAGYEGTGADWYLCQMDWAFGGERLFVGPYLAWGTNGLNEIHTDGVEIGFNEHGFATFGSYGLATYYFYDDPFFEQPTKFKLLTTYFRDRKNKTSGYLISPEVTIMPLKLVSFSVYYKLQSADLSKSLLENHEYLPRQTVVSMGFKLGLSLHIKD